MALAGLSALLGPSKALMQSLPISWCLCQSSNLSIVQLKTEVVAVVSWNLVLNTWSSTGLRANKTTDIMALLAPVNTSKVRSWQKFLVISM